MGLLDNFGTSFQMGLFQIHIYSVGFLVIRKQFRVWVYFGNSLQCGSILETVYSVGTVFPPPIVDHLSPSSQGQISHIGFYNINIGNNNTSSVLMDSE